MARRIRARRPMMGRRRSGASSGKDQRGVGDGQRWRSKIIIA